MSNSTTLLFFATRQHYHADSCNDELDFNIALHRFNSAKSALAPEHSTRGTMTKFRKYI